MCTQNNKFINNKNYAIMEKAIKLLQKVDKNNFMDLYIVISHPARNVRNIESIVFIDFEDAQQFANWRNERENTCIYSVFKTCMHV